MHDEKVYVPRSWWRNPSGTVPITAKPPELLPVSVVNARDTPLDAFAPGVFFRLFPGWLETNKNGTASTAAFVSYTSRCAGRDLRPFFDAWLFAPVTPEVKELE